MEQTPLVTVLATTYNQEKYIAQALDSVLAQKTDFPFEIYVSEDCGTDGTRTILQDYARRYPDSIRLNLRDKNVGISRNWYEGLCAARGEYVCTLEGDDWWLDDCKLQKQMDFLREHPDYAAVSQPFARRTMQAISTAASRMTRAFWDMTPHPGCFCRE